MPTRTSFVRSRLVSFYLLRANSYLVTSSVSYCAPPENLLVEQFDVAYFPSNNSLVFNVSAASVVRLHRPSRMFILIL